VDLLAPTDTSTAGAMVQASAMGFMFRDEEGMVEKFALAQQEFSELAKRDLADG
jgi:hypothetical protein